MKDCFAFRFFEPDEDKRSSLAVFFSSEISLDSAAKAIRKDVEKSLVPKNVYVMTLESSESSLSQFREDSSFKSEFDSYVGDIQEKLILLSVTPNGDFKKIDECDANTEELKKTILKSGMISLFKKHQGIITSSPSYHFVKPSGAHCDKFIRASNLLVSSNEVTFLAISLLPYLRKDLQRIYVDTSSISYLVNIAVHLFEGLSNTSIAIESFESYAAFNKQYDFVEDEGSLIVISATTSGSLAKSLLDKTSFNRNQIVTLFHLQLPDAQIGVFDVSSVVGQITSKKETECVFCKRGSRIIRISGDQFLPETPKHELLVIKKSDFNKQREKFFKEFAARKVLGWNTASDHQADSKEHFYLEVKQVFENLDDFSGFSKTLNRSIKRYISRDINTILCLDDAGSEALSKKIRDYLGDDASSMSWLKLGNIKEDDLQNCASVVVVAGAITSGRKLLAASRLLRCINESATIIYLVGFSKLPTVESFEQLKKDLCQGGHDFEVLRKCPVPRIKENSKTAWDWEEEELNKWYGADPLSEHNDELPKILKERLGGFSSEANDPNKLFLPDPVGNVLKLRQTFAFWSDLGIEESLENATQADVYWTIQAVLHDLRICSDENGLASIYHTTLISPACFDRYNDGIIQACLLRAAKPVELNYTVDPEFSRQMTDVLLSVFSNWRNPQGEAALEFLLALWVGRLQLMDDHIKEIKDKVNCDDSKEMSFILEQIAISLP